MEVEKFDDMGLKEEILRGIYAYGYKEPTPIQRKGILPVIQGKDTIAQVRKIKMVESKYLPLIIIIGSIWNRKDWYLRYWYPPGY